MLTFVGDYSAAVPFTAVHPIVGDAIVANLESAICAENARVGLKAYSLVVGSSGFRHVKKSGVAALSVANNHVYDAGAEAFERMIERLRDTPALQIYGLRESPYCELRRDGVRCVIIGCLERCRARRARLFRQEDVTGLIRELRAQADRIFVTPHWGKEGELTCYPSPGQRRLARQWIDAGADGIFGHHSHVFQGRERYAGKPIYYSLGNYLFDQPDGLSHPLSAWGLVVRVDVEGSGRETPMIVYQERGSIADVDDATEARLIGHLQEISDRLSDERSPWTYWRWAKAVGRTYVDRSRLSWRRRFGVNRYRTLPLWLAWNCLPTTLLLRLGAVCGSVIDGAAKASGDGILK